MSIQTVSDINGRYYESRTVAMWAATAAETIARQRKRTKREAIRLGKRPASGRDETDQGRCRERTSHRQNEDTPGTAGPSGYGGFASMPLGQTGTGRRMRRRLDTLVAGSVAIIQPGMPPPLPGLPSAPPRSELHSATPVLGEGNV